MKPRGICIALSSHGVRCRRRAVVIERVHLASDLYGFGSTWHEQGGAAWLAAPLCAQHGPDFYRRRLPRKGRAA